MPTWGDIKQTLRAKLWPQGEQVNLVGIHDTYFVDAMIDLQTYDECLKQDHTTLFPACATYFDCGLTVFNKPAHSQINRLSVADRTDPVTHHEDPTADIAFCNAIEYHQTEATYLQRYRQCHHRTRTITPALFFGLCGHRVKRCYPRPTDAGLPAGLPPLDMGLHYAQSSTDAHRRSPAGVWAIERGKIYVAPWIQSSEVVIVKWDGIDMQLPDNKPMDNDFLLFRALREWVRWRHAAEWDHEPETAAEAREEYLEARKELIERCIRETMVRGRQPSQAQSSPLTLSVLYWNDQPGSATATADTSDCPAGQVATASTMGQADVPAGSVSSPSSISDANELAQALAEEQAHALAIAKLVCYVPVNPNPVPPDPNPTGNVPNDEWPVTVQCQGGGSESYTVPAGTFHRTTKALANAAADVYGKQQANLLCASPGPSPGNVPNELRHVNANCRDDTPWDGLHGAPPPTGDVVHFDVAAGMFHDVDVAHANAQADTWGKEQAKAQLVCTWYNSQQTSQFTCPGGSVKSNVSPAGDAGTRPSMISQDDANARAKTDADNDAANQCGGSMVPSLGFTTDPVSRLATNLYVTPHTQCTISVTVTVVPGYAQVPSTGDLTVDTAKATAIALNAALAFASQRAQILAMAYTTGDVTACGPHNFPLI